MSDQEPNYQQTRKISKATKMVVIGEKISAGTVKAVCDYHYDQLLEKGVKILTHTTILPEVYPDDCDYCTEGKL